jgi:hypothetical protein
VVSLLAMVGHHTDSRSGPHPLLAQVPLTVSPFISLPTAVALPYTYKTVSSTLPPSVTVDPNNPDVTARYVVSATGEHTAHPKEILASCQSLEDHLKKREADAEKRIKEWEASVKQRELAEKRRVAPGWLDREEKLLRPTQASSSSASEKPQPSRFLSDRATSQGFHEVSPHAPPQDEGKELDRAFGVLDVK